MQNPFTKKYTEEKTDESLISKAVQGDKLSLEELIIRHQDWIYNIALRMVFYSDEAKDVTQEVLIKIITNLSSFKAESAFRTWAYRIVVNHILNLKKSVAEKTHSTNFEQYSIAIDKTPDFELHSEMNIGFNAETVVEEVKLHCMYGMLLCLDREQRMVFVLGALFGVTDNVGAELMQITKDNFRQKLSRARKDIFNFMNNKCGLIRKTNSCHCSKKARAMVDSGYVNPDNLMFNKNYIFRIKDITPDVTRNFSDYVEKEGDKLFSEQPFQTSPDFVQYIRKLINADEFKNIFNYN